MRPYITFGSNDKQTWTDIGVVDASSPEQARSKARETSPDWKHYSATTQRGWSPGTPHDKTITTWDEFNENQMTVDDILDEEEQQNERKAAIAAAKEAIGKPERERE